MAGKVFISYRRDDTGHQADRIYDAFCETIQRDQVFMDVDSIPPGANFRKILKDWVAQSEVLLALIGPGWIDARDLKTKERRLDNKNDFVRIEIGEALRRNIQVVPVLLDGTRMPDADLLPDDLKQLVYRQAAAVERRTFDADVKGLIRNLGLSQDVGRRSNDIAVAPEGRSKQTLWQRTKERFWRNFQPWFYPKLKAQFGFSRLSDIPNLVIHLDIRSLVILLLLVVAIIAAMTQWVTHH